MKPDKKFMGVSRNNQKKYGVHVWDLMGGPLSSVKSRNRVGSQWYLGSFASADDAARVADVARLKLAQCRGLDPPATNFPASDYEAILCHFRDVEFPDFVKKMKNTTVDTAVEIANDENDEYAIKLSHYDGGAYRMPLLPLLVSECTEYDRWCSV